MKQIYLSFFIVAATSILPTSSFCMDKTILTSNSDLYALCQVEVTQGKMDINKLSPLESFAKGLCDGYILGMNYTSGSYVATITKLGATQSQIDFLKSKLYCPPSGVTGYDMAKVYIDYLSQHPEEGNHKANSTMLNAFHAAYPCS